MPVKRKPSRSRKKRPAEPVQTVAEASEAGLIPLSPKHPDAVRSIVVQPDDELWDVERVCSYFGGDNKPLTKTTLYRGVKADRFPRPINVSAGLVRWLGSECRAARARSIERRDAGARTVPRHGGRKKRVA
jgi:predicted DNA-binding transcriptional regulator AlpA